MNAALTFSHGGLPGRTGSLALRPIALADVDAPLAAMGPVLPPRTVVLGRRTPSLTRVSAALAVGTAVLSLFEHALRRGTALLPARPRLLGDRTIHPGVSGAVGAQTPLYQASVPDQH
jgi:hypothetical protein